MSRETVAILLAVGAGWVLREIIHRLRRRAISRRTRP